MICIPRVSLRLRSSASSEQAAGACVCAQLCIANSERSLELARLLLEELGADVNVRDHEGWTPLHAAARFGLVELARYAIPFYARLHSHCSLLAAHWPMNTTPTTVLEILICSYCTSTTRCSSSTFSNTSYTQAALDRSRSLARVESACYAHHCSSAAAAALDPTAIGQHPLGTLQCTVLTRECTLETVTVTPLELRRRHSRSSSSSSSVSLCRRASSSARRSKWLSSHRTHMRLCARLHLLSPSRPPSLSPSSSSAHSSLLKCGLWVWRALHLSC